jgi:hypothetical protein
MGQYRWIVRELLKNRQPPFPKKKLNPEKFGRLFVVLSDTGRLHAFDFTNLLCVEISDKLEQRCVIYPFQSLRKRPLARSQILARQFYFDLNPQPVISRTDRMSLLRQTVAETLEIIRGT